MPYKTGLRLLGVARNPANGFPARLLVADIIIRARRAGDKQYVHAVFEVSRTIRLDDVTRAHSRAATVAAATGEPTIAAVVGETIQPPQQQEADEVGVKILLPAPAADAERRRNGGPHLLNAERTPRVASRVSHRPTIARTSTPRFLAQFGAYAGDAVRAVL